MILHTLLLLFFFVSCGTVADDNIAIKWAEFQLSMMRVAQPAQLNFIFSRAARLSVIVATSMYDTWTLYQPLEGANPYIAPNMHKLRVRPKMNPDLDKAISYAAYRALSGVLGVVPVNGSDYQQLIDAFFASLGYNKQYTQQTFSNEAGVGNLVAALVLQNRSSDGLNADGSNVAGNGQLYSNIGGWFPRNDAFPQVAVTDCAAVRNINNWQPARVRRPDGTTRAQTLNPSNANMADAVPFALEDVAEFRPPPPPLVGRIQENILQNSIDDMLQVFSQLGDYEKTVASFWQNGPNNRGNDEYNVQIAIDAARAAELPLGDTLKLLFSNAWTLWDVFITQFDGKLFYDPPRPNTIIQCVRANQQINSWKGPYMGVGAINSSMWRAYFPDTIVQNPSPEYPCGHCLTCGAIYQNLPRSCKGRMVTSLTSLTFPTLVPPR
jgi:hypothetical protein